MSEVDSPRPPVTHAATAIALAVVEDHGCFLVGKRPEDVPLAGFWEFPGGKVLEGETSEHAAVRECREETGQLVHVMNKLIDIRHEYDFGVLHLHFFSCRVDRRSELPESFRWVSRAKLAQLAFPPANRRVLELLCRLP